MDVLLIVYLTINILIAYINQTDLSFTHYLGRYGFYVLLAGLLIYGSYMLIIRNSDKSKKNQKK